jgi:hypothetical protein
MGLTHNSKSKSGANVAIIAKIRHACAVAPQVQVTTAMAELYWLLKINVLVVVLVFHRVRTMQDIRIPMDMLINALSASTG